MSVLAAGASSLREGAAQLRGGLNLETEFGELDAVNFRFGRRNEETQEAEPEENGGPLAGIRGAIGGAVDSAIQNTIGNAFSGFAEGGTRLLFILLGLVLITVGLIAMSRSVSGGLAQGIAEGLRDVSNAD